ncbi:urease accessory protein UreF [Mameliella alba]|nr:urease accessory protein UreF [Mameliella sediminis]MBY6115172.1 urease accessory protein UreF [Antarctobacter heliothermus]MBY6144943.1 urease accessory protein UreF [Mameliella alba]MBY6160469.1 urease accessory protein UreF [Mameliella alba]MBY6168939.1 urease accessory protein UreF [Mameliella alba]
MDPRLLTLTQWLSPAYPVGGFAYSHGLESAVRAGWVTDAGSLRDWLEDILTEGSGKADALWIRLAWHGETPAAELDALARAWQPARERLREADRQGAAFARVTAEVWRLDLPPMLLPVALGTAARQMGMAVEEVAALYLQSFAGNLVSAAQRLMPLGQTAAQAVLAELAPVCARVAADTEAQTLDDMVSCAFLSDVAAMKHETLEPRLFQS